MKNEEFDFLKQSSDYIDSCFKINGKKYEFSRTHCFAQLEFKEDCIEISRDTGLRYKPLKILKYEEINNVFFDLHKGTIYTKYISDPRKMMLFFPVVTIHCDDGVVYPFRNGQITSYAPVFKIFSEKRIEVNEKYPIFELINNITSQEEINEILEPYLEMAQSMWD